MASALVMAKLMLTMMMTMIVMVATTMVMIILLHTTAGTRAQKRPLLFVAYAELTPIRRLSPIEDSPGPSACAAADVLHDFFCIRKMPRGESGTRCAASSPKASGTRCAAS